MAPSKLIEELVAREVHCACLGAHLARSLRDCRSVFDGHWRQADGCGASHEWWIVLDSVFPDQVANLRRQPEEARLRLLAGSCHDENGVLRLEARLKGVVVVEVLEQSERL